MPTYTQLELDLWGDLKSALDEPQIANFQRLWQDLESAIAPLENNQQLHVAAEAISQIVEVYVKRANGILDSLKVTDNSQGPVLDDDFLSGLMRQSMAINLSDLMEEFAFDTEPSPNSGSVVSVIDRTEARALARKARAQMRKALKGLAEQEDIPKWQNAITLWISQHQEGEKVSLLQIQQALDMPLVEVWLGLLHSPMPYQWDKQGEFYQEARDLWICGINLI